MSRECEITHKKPMFGHKVSHANNKTKRTFRPNLQHKKILVPGIGWIKFKVSAKALRTIDKNGIIATLKKVGDN